MSPKGRTVADREPSPKAQFSALISRFSPESVALGKKCLIKLGQALPGYTQLVYEYNHSVVVSISPSDRGYEGVVALSIYPGEVRLYFQGAKSLPDPEGLLNGSGTKARFVVIEAASDLDKKEIQALLSAAIKVSGATVPRSGTGRMIIQSVQKDKKKKKKKAKKRS